MTTSTINIKLILDSCSVKEKVELFKQLYKDISSCGIHGDTELAHVNPFEAGILKLLGGAGTVNEATGLVQYFGGGSPPPPPPASQSVSQTSEFPEELKPYIKDVLSKAQAIQEKREAEGFVPYTGPQQAAFTPEQEQAFTGIQGLVGAGQQYFDPAARLTAASAMAPTSAEIGQYMSPYMQQVVDIQQREARRAADVEQQQLAAQAVGAGGYGGSRQAILEAEQRRNLQTQLGDIQARGLAAAYEDAQARLAAQRQREMAAGAQFGTLGQVAPQQALKELTAVEAVGAQRQAQQQTALDIAKQQFEKEQTFPETTLQQYQSVIRGFPLEPTTYKTAQTTTPAPSYLQQAAGLGMAGVGLAGAFGAFKADGGLIRRARGGKLDKNGGLGSIVVKKRDGGRPTTSVRMALTPPPSPPYVTNIGTFNTADILNETDKQRLERIFPGFKPKTFEEEYPEFAEGKGSRFSRTLASGLSGMRDFVKESGSQMGRDVTSLGEYLFEEKGQTPLSLGQIRAVQELEARRPDLAKTGEIRASAKKILKNAARDNKEVSPDLLSKAIALDLRPAEEAGQEAAAASARDMPSYRDMPPPGISPAIDAPTVPSKEDPYGVGVFGEYGQSPLKYSQEEEDITEKMLAEVPSKTAVPSKVSKPSEEKVVTMYGEGNIGDLYGKQPSETENAAVRKEEALKEFDSSSLFNSISSRPTLDKMRKEIEKLSTTKKGLLEKEKEGLNSDRWLAVANLGASILAQPGGHTFLEAIGKGVKESNIIGNLSKLNAEQRKVATNLASVDLETLQSLYSLDKDEAAAIRDAAKIDIAYKQLEVERDKAVTATQKAAIEGKLKLLTLNNAIRNTEFRIASAGKTITKEDRDSLNKIWNAYSGSYFWSSSTPLPSGIGEILNKKGVSKDKQKEYMNKFLDSKSAKETFVSEVVKLRSRGQTQGLIDNALINTLKTY